MVKSAGVFKPLPGVIATDSFTISITKAGVTTNVVIDLADVQGALTLDNINAYVNDELGSAGFATRFKRVQTGGDLTEGTATWGTEIKTAAERGRRAVLVAGDARDLCRGIERQGRQSARPADQAHRSRRHADERILRQHQTGRPAPPPQKRSPPTRTATSMSSATARAVSARRSIRRPRTCSSPNTIPPATCSGPSCSAAPAPRAPTRSRSIR